MKSKIITEISTKDALELGRIEGIKEILRELHELCNDKNIEVSFIRAYVKARLKTYQEVDRLRNNLQGI